MVILGLCIVHARNLYKAGVLFRLGLRRAYFYGKLTEGLLENAFDQPARRSLRPDEPQEISS